MIDMASPVREEIYRAIRAFTPASVGESQAATAAIIRLVANALPQPVDCTCGLYRAKSESGFPRAYGDWHPGDEM